MAQERNFREILEARWDKGLFVCVGLDSDFDQIPEHLKSPPNLPNIIGRAIFDFNIAIIGATKDLVCAYKPNLAFYLAYGLEGLTALARTIQWIKLHAPEAPVILDAKLGDIGNASAAYAKGVFDEFGADAVTVNPYLGQEALQPFLDRKDKGIIVLCRTSNKEADEFQDYPYDLRAFRIKMHLSLYYQVAHNITSNWNRNGNCGLIVSAIYPEELEEVRKIVGDMLILIPGIDAQRETVSAGMDSRGKGIIVNSSRGVIFASREKDFAEAAAREVVLLNERINQFRFKKES